MPWRKPILIYVSELAPIAGEETYFKTRDDAMRTIMERNGLGHPDDMTVTDCPNAEVREAARAIAALEPQTIKPSATPHTVPKPSQALLDKVDESIRAKVEKVLVATALQHHKEDVADAVRAVATLEPATVAPASSAAGIARPSQETLSKVARPEIRAEVQRELVSKAMQASGTFYEAKDIARERPKAVKKQQGYSKTFKTSKNGVPYKLFGRIDAAGHDGKLCEFKRRMRRLSGGVPHYEMPQLYGYMVLTGVHRIEQIETFQEKSLTHDVTFDQDRWDAYVLFIEDAVEEMARLGEESQKL